MAAQEAGWELEPSEDTAQRHAFNARLTDAISAALARVEVLPYWGDGPGRRDEPSKWPILSVQGPKSFRPDPSVTGRWRRRPNEVRSIAAHRVEDARAALRLRASGLSLSNVRVRVRSTSNPADTLEAETLPNYAVRKLRLRRVWGRILSERLTEPIHLNALSLAVLVLGSYSRKIDFDLIVRQQHAYGLLKAARTAIAERLNTVTVLEFGVASGAGIMNLAHVAERITRETGIRFEIYGFDTGEGMPMPRDHRDHPEYYQAGDFQMDVDALRNALPPNANLVIGNLADTVPAFIGRISEQKPIGFVSVDLDYYHSTVDALRVFDGPPNKYFALLPVYFDDTSLENHNSWCGELLAIREFNDQHETRKIEHHRHFADWRVFRNAAWIKQMYFLHMLDHPKRMAARPSQVKRYIENPYIERVGVRERFDI